MSLLLDALSKKSGENQHHGTGLGLTLEEAPAPRHQSPASTADTSAPAARAAGEKLFTAKKKKAPTMRWKLGLVPTTLLIALVFGSGYGYYVWLEMQPPSRPAVAQTPPPPPPAQIAVRQPQLVPNTPAMEEVVPTSAQPLNTASLSAHEDDGEEFDAPRKKTPVTTAPRRRPPSQYGSDVTIQRKVEGGSTSSTLLEAYQAYQRGDYVTAAQGYRQVLGKDANNRDALLGLAVIAQQQGQEESAQQYFRRVLALDPRDPVAIAAMTAYAPGSTHTESRLKQLLSDQPRSAALHFALGNLYAEQSNWSDAQQAYFSAHALEPANAQYMFNLAVSLDHLGQDKLAAQHYQQALQLDVAGNSGFDRNQAQQRLNELNQSR